MVGGKLLHLAHVQYPTAIITHTRSHSLFCSNGEFPYWMTDWIEWPRETVFQVIVRGPVLSDMNDTSVKRGRFGW